VVGREIRLAGEITSCDRLLVEGQVEADLSECGELTISKSGAFKGKATVKQASIAGLFEGDLVVLGHLIVKDGGRIHGRLVYRELEVQRGGKITGEVEELEEGGTLQEPPEIPLRSRAQPTKPDPTKKA
jgi:cytoskeletal protein CcmA (bactofilin family)